MLDFTLFHAAQGQGTPYPEIYLRPDPFPNQQDDAAVDIEPGKPTRKEVIENVFGGVIALAVVGGFACLVTIYH